MTEYTQRIESLKQTIATSEQRITELNVQRTTALAGDDDALVDRIDNDLNILRKRIEVSNERIAMAQAAELEAVAKAESDRLDAIAARADKARQVGESLFVQYAKAAATVAAVMAKLTVIDDEIIASNHQLRIANRPIVHLPNQIRCKTGERIPRTVRRKVGYNESMHPMFGKTQTDLNGNVYDLQGNAVEKFVEMDVTSYETTHGVFADTLQAEVNLPHAELNGSAFWPAPKSIDRDKIIREIGLDSSVDQPGLVSKLRTLVASKAA